MTPQIHYIDRDGRTAMTQPPMKRIRFKFAPRKALAALHRMVRERPGVDLHTVLKACYFADKAQLNAHGKPVFGATYRAMPFGPVPLEIYEMAKGEAYWLAELGIEHYPWTIDGYRLRLSANDEPDMGCLSDSDREALEAGFRRSGGMTFDARTQATHGADWQAAGLGPMRYEDMLDDSEDKESRVAYLREAAPVIRL